MPPEGDEQLPPAAPTAAPAAPPLTPEQIRSSPEFRAQEEAARNAARERGRAEAAAAAARQEAEQLRAAAEADAIARQEAQVRELLGEAGVARWNQIAETSNNDPIAAARLFREYIETEAQSLATRMAQNSGPAQPPPVNGGAPVPQNGGVPPMPTQGGVVAGAPLGQPAEDETWEGIAATHEQTFNELVARNQKRSTRNRMTQRDRAAGMIAYVSAAYARALGRRESEPARGLRRA